MRFFRHTLIPAALAVAALLPAKATAGENAFGLHMGYYSRVESALVGIYYQHSFLPYLRVTPAIDYVFRHDDVDAFAFNFDVDFPLLKSQIWNIYPLAGLNYTSWNYHSPDFDFAAAPAFNPTGNACPTPAPRSISASDRISRFGLNLGAGIEARLSSTIKLAVEAKATLIKHRTAASITAGIAYIF